MQYNAAIIGAGPAGATFARRLAQQSPELKILLLDAQDEGHKKPCGGLLAPDAQKTLAQIKKILRETEIFPTLGKTVYEMPADFYALYRVWADGRAATNRLRWRGGKLIVPEGYAAEIVVEYFALPKTIPADAPDSYEFEIAPDACECMPYYVAAQQLLPDLVMDYGAMLAMYNNQVSLLITTQPGENQRVTQSLWR